ncbi:MAG: DUF7948 domain-containing protein [Planctomycetota bacterium]|jgi:hypothetical protein
MVTRELIIGSSVVMLVSAAAGYVVQCGWAGTSLQDGTVGGTPVPKKPSVFSGMPVLPACFIANRGQVSEPAVRHVLELAGATVHLGDDGLTLSIPAFEDRKGMHAKSAREQASVFRMTLSEASKTRAQGSKKLRGSVNYYIGHDKSKWRTSIPTYAEVLYESVYPGIDMAVSCSRSKLKYEFRLAPGANPNTIKVSYAGVEGLSLDRKGNMHIRTDGVELIDCVPFSYQEVNGRRVEVKTSYRLIDKHKYGFAVRGEYDDSLPLVIDPNLGWSTFLGGSGADGLFCGHAIGVDAADNIYVTGYTSSTDWPAPPDPNSHGDGGDKDMFVAKLNSSGSSLLYLTVVGGTGDDYGNSMAIDSSGNAYITGHCESGFPAYPNDANVGTPYESNYQGGSSDAFLTKLDSSGYLDYSTFLGGSDRDYGFGIAVDGNGAAYITGNTNSVDFPNEPNQPCCVYDTNHHGGTDAFVLKVDPGGNGKADLLYSTYLAGGSGTDQARDIAVHDGNILVMGNTFNTNFQTTAGAYDRTHNGSDDFFIVRINPDCNCDTNDLVYSTFMGGSGDDDAMAMVVDPCGAVYVTGGTYLDGEVNFPTKGGYDNSYNGGYDVFVTKFNLGGNGEDDLVYSTFIGDTSTDFAFDMDVVDGEAFVTGYTQSPNFPTAGAAYDTTHNGNYDAFVCALSASGSDLTYSTFVGSSNTDGEFASIVADANRSVYVAGSSSSPNFPTTSGVYQPDYNDNGDVFAFKLPCVRVRNLDQDKWYWFIQDAINDANNSDRIVAYPSTYYEVIDFKGKTITVRSMDPSDWDVVAKTIIDAGGDNAYAVTFDGGEDQNSVLKGLTVTNSNWGGIVIDGSSTVCSPTVSNCIITDNGWGVQCHYGSCVFENNKIYENPVWAMLFAYTQAPVIKNNLIYSTVYEGSGWYGTGIYFTDANAAGIVRNNTIVGNDRGIWCDGGVAPTISNCIVWNNDVNDLVDCNATYSCIEDCNEADGAGNICGDANDPNFVSEPNDDYHLWPGSPCINTGDPNGSYDGEEDIDGDRRLMGEYVDMGADEADCLSADANEHADWADWGKPDCWCYRRQCRGDVDGLILGPFWVSLTDLGLFRAAYNKTDNELSGNDICADLDHTKVGPYRVNSSDLSIIQTYLNQLEASVPACDCSPVITGPYNFWTEP